MEPKIQPPHLVEEIRDTVENPALQAVNIAFAGIVDEVRNTPPSNVINLFGGQFPRRPDSAVDAIVAQAQEVYRASEQAHKDAIERGDYRQEKAAAMLATIFRNNELLISNFAEILEHFPEIADQVASLSPTLSALIQEKNRYEMSNSIKPVNNALNDEKYNVAA